MIEMGIEIKEAEIEIPSDGFDRGKLVRLLDKPTPGYDFRRNIDTKLAIMFGAKKGFFEWKCPDKNYTLKQINAILEENKITEISAEDLVNLKLSVGNYDEPNKKIIFNKQYSNKGTTYYMIYLGRRI